MKDEPSFMALAVNRILADLDEGFKKRTKPLRLTFAQIDVTWVPMLVCDYCNKGPITSLDNDDCCDKFLLMSNLGKTKDIPIPPMEKRSPY